MARPARDTLVSRRRFLSLGIGLDWTLDMPLACIVYGMTCWTRLSKLPGGLRTGDYYDQFSVSLEFLYVLDLGRECTKIWPEICLGVIVTAAHCPLLGRFVAWVA